MDANFSVYADPTTSLVRITIGGFFELNDIKRFAATRDAEHLRLRCAANRHSTLIDMRQMQIQSQESVEAFGQLLRNKSFISDKIAFVVMAGLARSQIHRAAAGRRAQFFGKLEDAEAWIKGFNSGHASLTNMKTCSVITDSTIGEVNSALRRPIDARLNGYRHV